MLRRCGFLFSMLDEAYNYQMLKATPEIQPGLPGEQLHASSKHPLTDYVDPS